MAYYLLLNKMCVASTLTISFAYSCIILINLNDEGKSWETITLVCGDEVRFIRHTLHSYSNISLIQNYPVG